MENGSEAVVRLQPNSDTMAAKSTPEVKKMPMMIIMVRLAMATMIQP